MKKIVMLHGINHGMFGKRDPKQYGTMTLAEIVVGFGVDSYLLALRAVCAAAGASRK